MHLPIKAIMNVKLHSIFRCLVLCQALIMSLVILTASAYAQGTQVAAQQQLWVTMHTAPMEDYCAACIVSEKLLREGQVEFRKVLEPMGPWPWFQLTDCQGNQKRVKGALSKEDVQAIKLGQFPKR